MLSRVDEELTVSRTEQMKFYAVYGTSALTIGLGVYGLIRVFS